MINWKTILGAVLIAGAITEFLTVLKDYKSGALEFWPSGVEIGFLFLLLAGGWLIKSGMKKKQQF